MSEKIDNNKEITIDINSAIENDSVSKLYGNNFSLALGVGDVALLLKNGPKQIALINLSYTTAKTLSIKLGEAISFLENRSKNTIMTMDEIEKSVTIKKEVQ